MQIGALLALALLPHLALAALNPLRDAEDNRRVDDPALIAAESSRYEQWRIQAATALGRIQDPRGIPALLKLLADRDAGVRRAALFAAGQFAWKPEFAAGREKELLAALKPFLLSRSARERALAIEAAGKLAMEDAPAIAMPLLTDKHAQVRAEAAMAIARSRIVFGLRNPGTQPAPIADAAVAALAARARDRDARVRRSTAFALLRLKDPRALAALVLLTRDRDATVRIHALTGIGRNPGATETSAKNAVIASTADQSYLVRVAAIDAAKVLKAGARLDAALARDRSLHVRAAYARAIADPAALEKLLGDASPTVRSDALRSLAAAKGAEALPALSRALADPNWAIRVAALEAAGALDDSARFAFALPALTDPDVRVRAAALGAVGAIASAEAYAAVLKALESPELAERGSAVEALAGRKEPDCAAAAWRAYLGSEGEKWIELREGLIDIVSATSGDETTRELRLALADPAGSVSAKAYRALKSRGITDVAEPLPPKLSYSPFRELHVPRGERVELLTTKGVIVLELYPDAAPIHVANFVGFASKGGYDGLSWHRVVSNFVIQGGDPDGTGWGSAGWSLRAEVNPARFERGALGMPRSDGFDTGGIQLFITHVPTPSLDGQYTVFGRVIHGMRAVDAMEVGDRILKARPLRHR